MPPYGVHSFHFSIVRPTQEAERLIKSSFGRWGIVFLVVGKENPEEGPPYLHGLIQTTQCNGKELIRRFQNDSYCTAANWNSETFVNKARAAPEILIDAGGYVRVDGTVQCRIPLQSPAAGHKSASTTPQQSSSFALHATALKVSSRSPSAPPSNSPSPASCASPVPPPLGSSDPLIASQSPKVFPCDRAVSPAASPPSQRAPSQGPLPPTQSPMHFRQRTETAAAQSSTGFPMGGAKGGGDGRAHQALGSEPQTRPPDLPPLRWLSQCDYGRSASPDCRQAFAAALVAEARARAVAMALVARAAAAAETQRRKVAAHSTTPCRSLSSPSAGLLLLAGVCEAAEPRRRFRPGRAGGVPAPAGDCSWSPLAAAAGTVEGGPESVSLRPEEVRRTRQRIGPF